MAYRIAGSREDVLTERTETHEPINVGKIAAFIIGTINVVIGAVGLARSSFEHPTGPTGSVGGMEMTGLLAMIHLVIGALTLAGASTALMAKSSLATIGAVLVIGGVIALIEPIEVLGWNSTNGFVYLALGVAALFAGMMTSERTVRQSRVVEESATEI